MGWNLDTGYILRDTHETIEYSGDDTFSISAPGVGGLLLPGEDGYYHTESESFWRIAYDAEADTWAAWDKQGTEYRFEARAIYPEFTTGCQNEPTYRAWRWSLTAIRNRFGQELTYTYSMPNQNAWGCDSGQGGRPANRQFSAAVYPATITFPHGRYKIIFMRDSNRYDYFDSWTEGNRIQYVADRLTEIRVKQDADGDGGFETMMRRYVFTYEDPPSERIFPGVAWPYNWNGYGYDTENGDLTLTQIQVWKGAGESLPPLTFGYDGQHLTWAEDGNGGRVEYDYEAEPWHEIAGPDEQRDYCRNGEQGFENWTHGRCYNQEWTNWQNRFVIYYGEGSSTNGERLTIFAPGQAYKIKVNAYGSNTSLHAGIWDGTATGYTDSQPTALNSMTEAAVIEGHVVLPATASLAQLKLEGTSWQASDYWITPLQTRYRVVEKRVFDGVSSSPSVFTYEYGTPATNDEDHSAAAGESEDTRYVEPYSEYRGHDWAAETGPGGRTTKVSYYQDDARKGTAWLVQVNQDSQVLLETETVFPDGIEQPLTTDPDLWPHKEDETAYTGMKIYWVRSDEEIVRYLEGGEGTHLKTTAYEYLEADQGGSQYGNLTRAVEYPGADTLPAYRVTRTRFYPTDTTNAYLVGLPAAVETIDCDQACDYDNPIRQTLYLYDGSTNFTDPPIDGKLTATRVLVHTIPNVGYSDEIYSYDTWGNRTTVTRYTGYGSGSALAISGARTTTTAYDSTYHTYAVEEWQSLSAYHWEYEYNYTKAVVTQETDPNGAVATATYDSFGRLLSVRKPGDETGDPTIEVTYHDTDTPFWVEIRQKLDASRVVVTRRIYDGLGHLVQTQVADAELGQDVSDVLVDTWYDAFGQVVQQSVPYSVTPWSGTGNPYREPPSGLDASATTYDALGRVTSTTSPDETQTITTHGDLTTTTEDANGNSTTTTVDVWGRVTAVEPPTGPAVTYGYDRANQLMDVTMGGAHTWLTYDLAGRKTSMDDPDMGDWTYGYDALGNLEEQTDARMCVTTMDYDELSRLETNDYSGSGACGEAPGVTYSYDEGTYGIGRLTGMSNGVVSTDWTYDARGRKISEEKYISGAGVYVTSWGYDSADNLISVRYPGGDQGQPGELVALAFNDQGGLASVASTTYGLEYAGLVYDSAGRTRGLAMASDALLTSFTFNDWSEQGGRLASIESGTTENPGLHQHMEYAYDDVGNILRIDDYVAGAPQAQTFTYDELDRLRSAVVTGGTQGLYNESYEYDP
ncbi:MAG: hypothetical protein A2147_09995 [Chloroflexi bacterium RBG_16_57_8]|nr:MAG: hypothetical protein A2147_09995 [Chloroflexi bacterium RBG_16_57_8]